MSDEIIAKVKDAANRMRITSIEATAAAKSGHPTSSASAAEIVATLFFHEMSYDVAQPKDASADRFVLSKGHACPILYSAWLEAGLLTKDQIMQLRHIDSDLEGHPTPVRERVAFVFPACTLTFSASTSSTLRPAHWARGSRWRAEWRSPARSSTRPRIVPTACSATAKLRRARFGRRRVRLEAMICQDGEIGVVFSFRLVQQARQSRCDCRRQSAWPIAAHAARARRRRVREAL